MSEFTEAWLNADAHMDYHLKGVIAVTLLMASIVKYIRLFRK